MRILHDTARSALKRQIAKEENEMAEAKHSADAGAKGPQHAASQTAGKNMPEKPVDLETALASLGSITEGEGDNGAAFHRWYEATGKAKVAPPPPATGPVTAAAPVQQAVSKNPSHPGGLHEPAKNVTGTVAAGTVDEQKPSVVGG